MSARGGDADRHVDVEDPLPTERVGQDTAEEHACDGPERAHCTPGTERRVAILALPECGHEDRQCRRRDERRTEPLQSAGADQSLFTPGQARDERGAGEDDDAGEKESPAPEEVGRATAEEQEAAEEQRVGADDPLQVLLREAEVGLDRGQSDVHDRDVEHDHELHRAEEREPDPLASSRSHHWFNPPSP